MNRSITRALPLLFSAAMFAGCHDMGHKDADNANAQPLKQAIATIKPAAGESAGGSVRFYEHGDGPVTVIADLTGLTPGEHGFHIHEKGDLSAPDLASVGGHFNPEGHAHGGPDSSEHHAGDLGNITADNSGHARLKATLHDVTIDGSHNPIIGRSVVVHAGTDDLKSQPAGNSGKKIGAGIIQMAP
jgi:superoxide dismutase, Cu-Zn family